MGMFTVGNQEYSPAQVIEQSKKAAGWFLTIAIFSVINTVLNLFNAELNFVIGLAITQFVDGLLMVVKSEAQGTVATVLTVIGLVVNLIIFGFCMLIWWLAKRGNRYIYMTGMVLYLLDGFLFLLVQDWVGVGFHVFFLYMLWGGYQFMKIRKEAEPMLVAYPQGLGAEIPVEAIESSSGGTCAECQGVLDDSTMIAFGETLVCPQCKDGFVQKMKEGVDGA